MAERAQADSNTTILEKTTTETSRDGLRSHLQMAFWGLLLSIIGLASLVVANPFRGKGTRDAPHYPLPANLTLDTIFSLDNQLQRNNCTLILGIFGIEKPDHDKRDTELVVTEVEEDVMKRQLLSPTTIYRLLAKYYVTSARNVDACKRGLVLLGLPWIP